MSDDPWAEVPEMARSALEGIAILCLVDFSQAETDLLRTAASGAFDPETFDVQQYGRIIKRVSAALAREVKKLEV